VKVFAIPTRISWVAGVGFLIGVAYALRILVPAGGNPSIFIALGEDSPRLTMYAQSLLGPVVVRGALGHDGRFFFPQANDPLYLEPERHAVLLDRPVYRGQRMLYPLLAGGLGLLPSKVVVWSMLGINLVALGLGAAVAGRLAVLWGASPWLGLAVPLNLGLLSELDIGGAGVLAMLLALGGVYALSTPRSGATLAGRGTMLASVLFTLAALSREVTLLFATGVVVVLFLRHRRIIWQLLALPALAVGAWRLYLLVRLADLPSGGADNELGAPLVGIWEAFGYWLEDPIDLAIGVVLLTVLTAFALRAVRSRNLLAWGALPTVALALILSVYVWREPYDIARAIAPVLTAYPFLLFLSGAKRTTELSDEHAFG
jgi:hypothetical protein